MKIPTLLLIHGDINDGISSSSLLCLLLKVGNFMHAHIMRCLKNITQAAKSKLLKVWKCQNYGCLCHCHGYIMIQFLITQPLVTFSIGLSSFTA